MITRQEAYKLLTDHVTNLNLVHHCEAVEAVMRELASYFQEGPEPWGIAGLLHDADWEVTRDKPEEHTLKLAEWLEDFDLGDDRIKEAILAHNHFHNGHQPPQTLFEWALYCCDELTGLIVACALVQPDKKLASVTADSVLRKLNQSGFAAGVNREHIKLCEDKLGIPLDEFVSIAIGAMQGVSETIGL